MTNDAGFALAYAVIMLNTDQHNHNVRKQNIPMTVEVSEDSHSLIFCIIYTSYIIYPTVYHHQPTGVSDGDRLNDFTFNMFLVLSKQNPKPVSRL